MTAPPPRWRLVVETLALLVGLGVIAMLAVHGLAMLIAGAAKLARQMIEAAGR